MRKMKFLVSLVVILVFCMVMTACAGKNKPGQDGQADTVEVYEGEEQDKVDQINPDAHDPFRDRDDEGNPIDHTAESEAHDGQYAYKVGDTTVYTEHDLEQWIVPTPQNPDYYALDIDSMLIDLWCQGNRGGIFVNDVGYSYVLEGNNTKGLWFDSPDPDNEKLYHAVTVWYKVNGTEHTNTIRMYECLSDSPLQDYRAILPDYVYAIHSRDKRQNELKMFEHRFFKRLCYNQLYKSVFVRICAMNKKALLKYLSALLLFGLNGIVASQITMNSYEIVFLRTLIGSVLLITLFKLSKGRFHLLEYRKDSMFIVLSGIAMGTSWMFLYEAYQQIGVSLASLLYYCGPVIVMVLSPVIFKEKLTTPKVIGFMIVLAGIVLVNGKSAISGNGWGVFCGAMSAIMYFFMVTLNKQSRIITGMENAVIQLSVSFLTVAVFVGFKQAFVIHIPEDAWLWIMVLGILNTGIGCYLYFSPLSQLPVQTVAICGYLEPLSAVIFAAILLNEKMTVVQIIGAVCIIGGAMIGELVTLKPTH